MDLCHSHTPGESAPTMDFVGAGRTLNLRGFSGGMAVTNMTSADNVATLDFIAGQIIIESSCTAGTLVYRGNVFPINDNSAGTTVINNSTSAAVNDVLSTAHGTGSWTSATADTLEGHSVTQMNANPDK